MTPDHRQSLLSHLGMFQHYPSDDVPDFQPLAAHIPDSPLPSGAPHQANLPSMPAGSFCSRLLPHCLLFKHPLFPNEPCLSFRLSLNCHGFQKSVLIELPQHPPKYTRFYLTVPSHFTPSIPFRAFDQGCRHVPRLLCVPHVFVWSERGTLLCSSVYLPPSTTSDPQ